MIFSSPVEGLSGEHENGGGSKTLVLGPPGETKEAFRSSAVAVGAVATCVAVVAVVAVVPSLCFWSFKRREGCAWGGGVAGSAAGAPLSEPV